MTSDTLVHKIPRGVVRMSLRASRVPDRSLNSSSQTRRKDILRRIALRKASAAAW